MERQLFHEQVDRLKAFFGHETAFYGFHFGWRPLGWNLLRAGRELFGTFVTKFITKSVTKFIGGKWDWAKRMSWIWCRTARCWRYPTVILIQSIELLKFFTFWSLELLHKLANLNKAITRWSSFLSQLRPRRVKIEFKPDQAFYPWFLYCRETPCYSQFLILECLA